MEILGVEKLTDEKWLNLFAAQFRYHDHSGRWLFASRKADPHASMGRSDAVIIVPTMVAPGEPDRLVVVKEFRVPVGGYVYGFPAGLLEPGESAEATARREIVEETGMDIVRIKRVSPPLYSSAGMTDEAVALVFADVRLQPGARPKLEASEELDVLLWDFATVCRMCEAPDTQMDAKVWSVVFMCQQLGRIV